MNLVEDRKQIKIFVNPVAKRVVAEFAARFDMTETGVASRFFKWFATLPEPVQKWIVGLTDGTEGNAIGQFAKMLTGEKIHRFPSDVDAAAEAPREPDPTPPEEPKENAKGKRGGRSK